MKFAAILLLATAGIYAIGDAVLAPTPTPEHPGFVDAVLARQAVVAAIRLAIIFAGVFVIVSVVALISQGRWLTRVGPVQVSETKTDDRRIKEEVVDTSDGLDRLRQQIAGVDEALNEYPVNQRIQMNEKQIQKLRELNREALETADEVIKSLDEVQRTAQRLEERHREELRQAESRRPGIFRALFQ